MPIRTIDATLPGADTEIDELLAPLRAGSLTSANSGDLDVPAIVSDILDQVRRGGDEAAAALTSRLDDAEIRADQIRVTGDELERAHAAADKDFLELVRLVAGNIRAYQEHILHRAPEPLLRGGRRLGVRYTPVDRVGVYVPGGRALYPSTILMTIVPAQVAGVGEIVIASPPTGGAIHPLALALAAELGIEEVLQLGGAVAAGALAFGTETIAAVQMIVGPGNAFVAEAKRQLFGRVGIDALAGPSEVLIVADASASPDWVAADLLAQAEHDPGAALLLTPCRALADSTTDMLERQLAELERADVTRASLEAYGAVIVTRDLAHACDIANEVAPEHLQLMTEDDEGCLARIRHAGAVFLGGQTPVPLGDYVAGPSHVLPTGGGARFFGPLSCNDFLKASSTIEYTAESRREDEASVVDFATREGLTAHARAVRIRSERPR